MSERDSHFAGFAQLLLDEIEETYAWVEPFQGDGSELDDLYRGIARRAYDFAFHVLSSASPFASPVVIQRRLDGISAMECWPDMEKIQKRIQQLEAPLPESGAES